MITTNKIRDYFRKLKRERAIYIWETDTTEWIADIQDEEADILAHLQEREEVQSVLAALMRLDEKYRTVLILHLIYEKTIPEIAAEFQMSYDTVKTRYRRGIQLLRERCCKKAVSYTHLDVYKRQLIKISWKSSGNKRNAVSDYNADTAFLFIGNLTYVLL